MLHRRSTPTLRILAILAVALSTIGLGQLFAAAPPDAINYQGVLRDGDGDARDGTFDMTFRFFDADVGGNEIVIDQHVAAGTGGVTVSDGLFSVSLGTGDVIDGAAALAGDPFDSLAKAFGAFGEIWMQIEIDAGVPEILSPRIKVVAAPFALNAAALDGRDASGFLDVSPGTQTKQGDLAVDNLMINDAQVSFSTGPRLQSNLATLRVIGGASLDDDLLLEAGDGSTPALGRIALFGQGPMLLRAGNGLFSFANAAGVETASLQSNGTLSVSADLNVGGASINLGGFGLLSATPGFNWLRGDEATDDLFLYASSNPDDGAVIIRGGDSIEIRSGTGTVDFTQQSLNLAQITSSGNLVIGMDASDDDDSIVFDAVETLTWDDSQTRFELSDSLAISGPLNASSTSAANVNYHRFGSTTAIVASDITNTNDVLISGDLEVGDVAYVSRSIVVGDSTATANQQFSSFGTGLQDSGEITTSNDVYVTDDLEVDGTVFTNNVEASSSTTFRAPTDFNFVIDQDNSGSVNEARWYHNGSTASANQLAEIQESGNLRIRGALSQFVAFDVAESFLAVGDLQPGEVVAVDPSRPDAVRRSEGVDDATIGVVSTRPGVLLGGAPFDEGALREIWGDAVHRQFLEREPLLRDSILVKHEDLRRALSRLDEEAQSIGGTEEVVQLERSASLAAERIRIESEIEGLALERFCAELLVPVALIGRVPVQVDSSFGAIRRGDALAPSPLPGVAMRAQPGSRTIGIALADFDAGRGQVMTFIDRGQGGAMAGPDAGGSPAVTSIEPDGVPSTAVAVETTSGSVALAAAVDRALIEASIATSPLIELAGREGDIRDLEVVGRPDLDDRATVVRVDASGNLFTRGSMRPTAREVAEWFPVDRVIEAGDVLVAATDGSGRLAPAGRAFDPTVIGVASSESGLLLGGDLEAFVEGFPELAARRRTLNSLGAGARAEFWGEVAERFDAAHVAVAMTGTVEVKVDAGYGAIRPGDLLTTSPTTGHAMVATDAAPGTILGKALGGLEAGMGKIRMVVMLR